MILDTICVIKLVKTLIGAMPKRIKRSLKIVLLSPTGRSILPFFWADAGGWREYGEKSAQKP